MRKETKSMKKHAKAVAIMLISLIIFGAINTQVFASEASQMSGLNNVNETNIISKTNNASETNAITEEDNANERTQINQISEVTITNEASNIIRVAGISDILNAGNNFISQGKNTSSSDYTAEYFATQFIDIGQVLVAIGVVTLLIVFAIMAIKWITAKPDKKAQLQQQLIGLVVAAVVIFGAVGIWRFVKSIGENVETKLSSSIVNETCIYIAKIEQ